VSKLAAFMSGLVIWSQNFRGKGSSLVNIFWFLQNKTHFAIQRYKLHRATCRRFDTIPADRQTDRQTDGIAVASTALAMPALRRAVKRSITPRTRHGLSNEPLTKVVCLL